MLVTKKDQRGQDIYYASTISGDKTNQFIFCLLN